MTLLQSDLGLYQEDPYVSIVIQIDVTVVDDYVEDDVERPPPNLCALPLWIVLQRCVILVLTLAKTNAQVLLCDCLCYNSLDSLR